MLSIDIGGSKIVAGVVDSGGSIYGRTREELKYPLTGDELVQIAVHLGREAIREYGHDDVRCAAATIPGLANPAMGIWVYSSFSGIRDFPLAERLSEELGFAVVIENDVNSCAIAEIKFGSCADVKNFLWVTVSNGIGGCTVINGSIYQGAYNHSGEIGHVCVDEDGPLCRCGNRGCAEACAAGPAILQRYLEKIGCDSNISELNAERIAEKARKGDPHALKVYEETGYYLGKAIAASVNILNPQKVILGGGVSMDMDLFYQPMKETLDGMIFHEANGELSVEKTALGYDAALLGAAAIGFEFLLK